MFHWEIENEVKQLKRNGKFDEALTLLLRSIEFEENEARTTNRRLYPRPYEEAALIFRKLKRYDDEALILEKFLSNPKAMAELNYQKIVDRLEKACLLAGKTQMVNNGGYRKIIYSPDKVDFAENELLVQDGLIVDVETTGFDVAKDEIIELGTVLFSYNRVTNQPLGIKETYVGLKEPSKSIPSYATRVHGLKDNDVRGKSFDENAVRRLFDSADFFIAHNASFDRRFLRQIYPDVDEKEWYCSMNGIDWKGYGHQSKTLQNLIADFHINVMDAHRGLDDAMAIYTLLSQINKSTEKTFFNELLNGFSDSIYNNEERLSKVEKTIDSSSAEPKKSFWGLLFGKRG